METAVSMVNTTNSSAALVVTSPNPTTSTSNSSSTNANLHHGDKKNDQKIPSADHCEDILKESFGGDENATEKGYTGLRDSGNTRKIGFSDGLRSRRCRFDSCRVHHSFPWSADRLIRPPLIIIVLNRSIGMRRWAVFV